MSRKINLITLVVFSIIASSPVLRVERVQASGVIYIRADGTVDPPSSPIQWIGDLYTITDEIDGSIDIEGSTRVQTTLDGQNYTVTERVWSRGNDNVTIKNMRILGGWPIFILRGSYNKISGNNLNSFPNFTKSSYNRIFENKFNCSLAALGFEESSNNIIYHNNFINATRMSIGPFDLNSVSVWDDGYPSGGNFWSDYQGVDFYSGPYQNLTGSDGIGDTPYVVKGMNPKNIDRYPLMRLWGSPDTIPPRVHVLSPVNDTYLEKSLLLSFTLTEATSWIGFSLDTQSNVTISGNTTLYNLQEGKHTIAVYANDTSGNMGRSDIVRFTVHTMPPIIRIILPQNKTYSTSSVNLNFTIDEPTMWIGFTLDGGSNVTVHGPTSFVLSGLSDGSHTVIVYATDIVGHTGASEKRYFSINSRLTTTSTPTLEWPILAALIVIASVIAGLIGYRAGKKRPSVRQDTIGAGSVQGF